MTPILYTVTYRQNNLFKTMAKIENVEGDGLIQDAGLRFFKRITGELVYIPIQSEVWFSKEREIAIRSKVKEEAGQ